MSSLKTQRHSYFHCQESGKKYKIQSNCLCAEGLVQTNVRLCGCYSSLCQLLKMIPAQLILWVMFSCYPGPLWLIKSFHSIFCRVPQALINVWLGSLHLLQPASGGSLSDDNWARCHGPIRIPSNINFLFSFQWCLVPPQVSELLTFMLLAIQHHT